MCCKVTPLHTSQELHLIHKSFVRCLFSKFPRCGQVREAASANLLSIPFVWLKYSHYVQQASIVTSLGERRHNTSELEPRLPGHSEVQQTCKLATPTRTLKSYPFTPSLLYVRVQISRRRLGGRKVCQKTSGWMHVYCTAEHVRLLI